MLLTDINGQIIYIVTLILALTQSYHSTIYATVTYFVVLTLGLLTLDVSAQLQKQSPINIDTGTTLPNPNPNGLTFNQYWAPVLGDFENTGNTIRFVPRSPSTLTTHQGTYKLKYVDFRWARMSFQGSEHQLNHNKFAAEIQFVHLKRGASPADDTFSIVAVLCDSVPIAPTGVWSKLSSVLAAGQQTLVSNIEYADLLPANRDYYEYEGSHTTPPFAENVQWYVMQNTIDIPEGFLASLRAVQPSNFRDVQDLNGREVFKFPSP